VSHKTQSPCYVLELKCGLLFGRHETSLTRRFVVYYLLLRPLYIEGKLIIGDDICPFLKVREIVQDDYRHGFEVERTRGAQASVSGEDARILIHEDGICEPKLAYAAGNLLDLLGAVRSWISVERLKAAHGPVFDPGWKKKLNQTSGSVFLGFSSTPVLESVACLLPVLRCGRELTASLLCLSKTGRSRCADQTRYRQTWHSRGPEVRIREIGIHFDA
jgi:hypothetical protein